MYKKSRESRQIVRRPTLYCLLIFSDNDNNHLYSVHKPKRHKQIWGALSRDHSRCVPKIISFKVGFERWYGTYRLDLTFYTKLIQIRDNRVY